MIVEMYVLKECPYCYKAKFLLKKKKINFIEKIIDDNLEMKLEMIKRSNGNKTVPQIFIKGKYIGGCNELYKLEANGNLDKLINEY